MNTNEYESPCIGVCVLNDDNVCEACDRTLEEIRSVGVSHSTDSETNTNSSKS